MQNSRDTNSAGISCVKIKLGKMRQDIAIPNGTIWPYRTLNGFK